MLKWQRYRQTTPWPYERLEVAIAMLTAVLANTQPSYDRQGEHRFVYRKGSSGAMELDDFRIKWGGHREQEVDPQTEYEIMGLRHKAIMDDLMLRSNTYFKMHPEALSNG
jgi:hypothetical protein